jgi:hypothetical protein
MTTFVKAATDQGDVLFEVDALAAVGPEQISRDGGNIVASLHERLDTALARVRPAAESIMQAFDDLAPKSITVEFGLKLDAEAGAFIARTGVEGHFTVTLTLEPERHPSSREAGVDY